MAKIVFKIEMNKEGNYDFTYEQDGKRVFMDSNVSLGDAMKRGQKGIAMAPDFFELELNKYRNVEKGFGHNSAINDVQHKIREIQELKEKIKAE